MLGRLRIRTKLAVLVAVPVVALLATGVLGWTTLQNTKVLGPRYDSIKTSQGLIADVMPPPDNVMESYLVAYQAVAANGSARTALLQRFDSLRKSFEDGHAYWTSKLTAPSDSELRATFLGTAYSTGHDFYSIALNQFEPSLASNNVTEARKVLDTTMAGVYAQHRAAINRTTTLALQREQQSEQAANKFVSSRTVTLLALFLAILALAALLGILIARAITRSIERIHDQANDAATAELPDLVLRIDSLREGEELPTLPPITVPSHDELSELAEALTTMQNTAVRLAAEQAMVRRNVSDVFVSLGRRNQGLLTRQLSFITDLEREQTDDETLADLFRLDHLATRMRRNAESLLVLAGAEPSRKVQQPMAVGDVVRAALSEIEDYSRVDFGAIEPTSLKGNVATDAAHMLAELLENAASFSPPDAAIEVVGSVSHEGYLLTITDHGMGMDSETLLEANRRISKVTHLDRAPSKVLGLYVVGRLAIRHGIAVFLSETPNGGVTAKVMVPARLLQDPTVVAPIPAEDTRERPFERPVDEPAAIEPAASEAPVLDDTGLQGPAPEGVFAEAPVAAEATSEAPVADDAVADEPVLEAPVAEETLAEAPTLIAPGAEIAPEAATATPEPETPLFAALADVFAAHAAISEHTAEAEVEVETETAPAPQVEAEPVVVAAAEPTIAAETETETEVPAEAETVADAGPSFALSALDAYSFTQPLAPVDAEPAAVDGPRTTNATDDTTEATDAPAESWWPAAWDQPHTGVEPTETEPPASEPVFAETDQPDEPDAPHTWHEPVGEPQPVAHDHATVTAVVEAPVDALAEATTEAPTLLPRRVRGAHLPDTGPSTAPEQKRARTADDVRNSLNRFRAGVKRGRGDDTNPDGKDS